MTWLLLALGGTTLAGWALSGYLVLVNRTLRAALATASDRAGDWEVIAGRNWRAAEVARNKLADAHAELSRLDQERAREVLEGTDPAGDVVDLLNGLSAGTRDQGSGGR